MVTLLKRLFTQPVGSEAMRPLQTLDVTAADPASAGVNRHTVGARWKRSLRRHWQLYLLVILPLAYFFIFKYVPMSYLVIAFKQYNVVDGTWGSPWVGWQNFESFFQQPGVLDVDQEHLHPLGLCGAGQFSAADHLGADAERGEASVLPQDGADGHLCAVLHLDGGDRVDDHPDARSPPGDREQDVRPVRHRSPRSVGESGLLPAHLCLVRRLADHRVRRRHLSCRAVGGRSRHCTSRRRSTARPGSGGSGMSTFPASCRWR